MEVIIKKSSGKNNQHLVGTRQQVAEITIKVEGFNQYFHPTDVEVLSQPEKERQFDLLMIDLIALHSTLYSEGKLDFDAHSKIKALIRKHENQARISKLTIILQAKHFKNSSYASFTTNPIVKAIREQLPVNEVQLEINTCVIDGHKYIYPVYGFNDFDADNVYAEKLGYSDWIIRRMVFTGESR